MSSTNTDPPSLALTLPPTLLRANELRARLADMTPSLKAGFNEEHDYVGLLTKGDELGMWRYLYHETETPRRFFVEINGRQRWLLESEVTGWVVGVLDACLLPIGPFEYREGL